MIVNIKECLEKTAQKCQIGQMGIQLPEIAADVDKIRCIMINEVPPLDPEDYFYSEKKDSSYAVSVLGLFRKAGMHMEGMSDLWNRGIYLTTAVKSPKTQYAVDNEIIKAHLPILEQELKLFSNLKVIMLMGDVAKKAFNSIAKKNIKKNVVPAGSTYKIRSGEFYYGEIRVFPSYIMTGGNILIEKSKCVMIAEDIANMMDLLSTP